MGMKQLWDHGDKENLMLTGRREAARGDTKETRMNAVAPRN